MPGYLAASRASITGEETVMKDSVDPSGKGKVNSMAGIHFHRFFQQGLLDSSDWTCFYKLSSKEE
jgi:hypothetical protein